MSFQALHRGILRTGGTATAVSVLSSWMGDRATSRVVANVVAEQGIVKKFLQPRQHQYRLFSSKASPTDSATTVSAPKQSSPGFREWYEGHLQSSPVRTKMVTGCILWSIGDAVGQVVPQAAATGGSIPDDFVYDWPRTGRAALFGFAVHAPTSHLHYNFLEWMTNRLGVTGLGIPVFKTIMEQFVYWSWISNSMYHGFMGLMQGMTPAQIYKRIEDVLWDTQKAQWAFWIPVQLLNFQFIPVRHQLNVVLVTSIVWTALLSAWYPPVNEKDEKDKHLE